MAAVSSGACAEPEYPALRPGLAGFNLIAWTQSALTSSQPWKRAIDEIRGLGASRVTLVPFAFFDPDVARVAGKSRYGLVCGPRTSVLREAVRYARKNRMEFSIKPMIEIDNPVGEGEIWRGKIRLTEEKLEPFFNSYRELLLEACELAGTEGASRFYIGSELGGLTGNSSGQVHWAKLIADCRGRLAGSKCLLSYAANYDEYEEVPFWEQLDEIAIDAYFPLATRAEAIGAGRPGESEIRKYADGFVERLRVFAEMKQKPLFIAEWGVTPFDLTTVDPSDEKPSSTPDRMEAINAYRAVIASFGAQGNWLTGVDFWHWSVGPDDDSNYAIRSRGAIARLIRRSLHA